GSDGLKVASAYIQSQFISYGIDTMTGIDGYEQSVPFRSFTPPEVGIIILDTSSLVFPNDFIAINGNATEMTAPIVNIGYGSAEEIAEKDLRFKIAVSYAGDGVDNNPRNWVDISSAKRARVAAAGGSALIEIYQSTSIPWRFLRSLGTQSQTVLDKGNITGNLLNLWVGTSDSSAIAKLKTDDKLVNIKVDGVSREQFSSANVIGFVEGTDPVLKDEFIVYSAHYDHVGVGRADAVGDTIYNGTRDNAVGTTSVLSLASYFSKHPPKRSSLFVLFTAEEKGLLGSQYFTENLPVPAEKIVYNFNIDNGGYNDTTIISVIGLTRTEAEQDIQAACQQLGLEAIEDAAGEQGLFDRSDNVNFARLGIPAPTFSLGFRSFDAEIMKYYHQPGDEVETINLNYVTKYVHAYILSADRIANRESAPFWREGDKYYDVGVNLYRKSTSN
ncbi:MAG: M28 family peptidase, partial [Bacteroidota bacterium]